MYSYKDLDVWKISMSMVKDIYTVTSDFPEREKYGLGIQMRRAAVSVPCNIAEGFGRESRRDFVRFLKIARGSIMEIETQLLIAKDLDLICEGSFHSMSHKIVRISKMLAKLIQSLR